MKKAFLIIAIAALSFPLMGQQFIQMIQDSAGLYRFQRLEIREYDDFTDTLTIDKFPGQWLDSAALSTFQKTIIDRLQERQDEQARLLKIAKDEKETHMGYYDGIHGQGAWLALEKQRLLESIQGNWILIDRNGEVKKHNITIDGIDFRKNQNKFGTIAVTDDLEIQVTGFYNFDLLFNKNRRFKRNNRLYILKR